MVALSRKAGKKIQRIIISADGSWLSNGELGTDRRKIISGNYSLVNGIFSYFTNGQLPVDMRRPAPLDNRITLDKKTWSIIEVVLKWILPGLIVLIAVIGWIRRRGR
jgi:ABC-2 type transport system permease protein